MVKQARSRIAQSEGRDWEEGWRKVPERSEDSEVGDDGEIGGGDGDGEDRHDSDEEVEQLRRFAFQCERNSTALV